MEEEERQPLLAMSLLQQQQQQQQEGRILVSNLEHDDMHSYDLMLLRATVFVEDACSLRPITHR